MSISFQAQIIAAITSAASKLQPPDKSNTGALLSEAFLWDMVQDYAKKKSDEAWTRLEKAEIYNLDDAGDTPGTFVLAKSPRFTLQVTQSKPVKRFSTDYLAEFFKKSKYKIPEPITKQACEDAKQPTKPTRSLKIVEVLS